MYASSCVIRYYGFCWHITNNAVLVFTLFLVIDDVPFLCTRLYTILRNNNKCRLTIYFLCISQEAWAWHTGLTYSIYCGYLHTRTYRCTFPTETLAHPAGLSAKLLINEYNIKQLIFVEYICLSLYPFPVYTCLPIYTL